ncbi:CAP domain-containing protein [Pseudoduganella sp. SL102]|uniref:CAP domain-containing protein n=1 Tax=Pseudoduganella sp. SL102 TaxID=2995154 RepID=UPI00248BC746|nr:CAP domain-containing protein [Pseudoduganella sp. SL102]WBS04261.1 CAP domain-containing protein [Pseudoduganella sp. SL102]
MSNSSFSNIARRAALLPVALVPAALLPVSALALPAQAPHAPNLAALINAYRAAPGSCAGTPAASVPPLAVEAALSQIRIVSGTFLEPALERAGYPVEHAEAVFISGAADAGEAMETLREKYCSRLLGTDVTAIGTIRVADGWHVVLARPERRELPAPEGIGEETLAAVNAARAAPRQCGDRQFAAAPPLRLNPALDAAALSHSRYMAQVRYFSHQQKNGSVVGDRALRAGYKWRTIGENIASGQRTAQEAVQGWLDSPGHCANIMNAAFVEMGVGYAVNPVRGTLYWTQVLAR